MTRIRWIILAALVTAIILLQSLGLQEQGETKEEERFRRVADIPASDMVPTYVASLFFGAFRAVVVDALWIQLKKVEEEKRWYEQRQTFQLISYFQPRNPEVWAHLGWHSAYNVANGFTDPEKSWEWVKFGLKWLRQGNTMLHDSTYPKYELARTISIKPTWKDGILNMYLLAGIERDPPSQKYLQPPKSPPVPPPPPATADGVRPGHPLDGTGTRRTHGTAGKIYPHPNRTLHPTPNHGRVHPRVPVLPGHLPLAAPAMG
jgi:hypothetical protein